MMACQVARHLGCERLALPVGAVPIRGNGALELGPEAVVPLADGGLGGEPEGSAQPRLAERRQLCLTAERA